MDSILEAGNEGADSMSVASSVSDHTRQSFSLHNDQQLLINAEQIVHNAISTGKRVYSQESVAMADKQQRHQKQQQQQIQHPKEVNKVKANVKSEQHQTTSSPPVDKQQKKAASPVRKESPVRFHRGFGFDEDQIKYCLYCLKPIDSSGGHKHGSGQASATRQRPKSPSPDDTAPNQTYPHPQPQQHARGRQKPAATPASVTGTQPQRRPSHPGNRDAPQLYHTHLSPPHRSQSPVHQRGGYISPCARNRPDEDERPASLIPAVGSRAVSPRSHPQQPRGPLASRRQQETVLQRAQRLLREAEQSLFCELFCPCECLGDVVDPIRHRAAASQHPASDSTKVKSVSQQRDFNQIKSGSACSCSAPNDADWRTERQDGDRHQQQRQKCGSAVDDGAGVKVTGGGAGGRSQRKKDSVNKEQEVSKGASKSSLSTEAGSTTTSPSPASQESAVSSPSISSSTAEAAPSAAQTVKSTRVQAHRGGSLSGSRGKMRPLTEGHREGREAGLEMRKGALIRIADYGASSAAAMETVVTEADCYLCQAEKQQQQQQQVNRSANNFTTSSPTPDVAFDVKQEELAELSLLEIFLEQQGGCVGGEEADNCYACIRTGAKKSSEDATELEFEYGYCCCIESFDGATVACDYNHNAVTADEQQPITEQHNKEESRCAGHNTNVNNGLYSRAFYSRDDINQRRVQRCEKHVTRGQGQDECKVAKIENFDTSDDTNSSRTDRPVITCIQQHSSKGQDQERCRPNQGQAIESSSRRTDTRMDFICNDEAKWVVWIEKPGEEILRYHKWTFEDEGQEFCCSKFGDASKSGEATSLSCGGVERTVQQATIDVCPTQPCCCRQLASCLVHGITRVAGPWTVDKYDTWLSKTHCAADRTSASDWCLTHI